MGSDWAEFNLIAGVSGGMDSTVLLHALSRHFDKKKIYPVHFNYHLRGEESDGDQAFMEEFCRELGLSCDIQHRYYEETGLGNLQDWARGVRYKYLSTIQMETKAVALTAHHAQDQAETILIRIMQGYPPFLCTGMEEVQPWKSGRNLVRPMLEIWPGDIHVYAGANDLKWREDSSNKKDDYLRNRVRHHVLTGLEAAFGEVWGDNLIRFGRSLASSHSGDVQDKDRFGNPAVQLSSLEASPFPWHALARLTGHYITPGKSGEIIRTLKANRLKSVKLEIGTLVRERNDNIVFLNRELNLLPIVIDQTPQIAPLPDGRVAMIEDATAPELDTMIGQAGESIFYMKKNLPLTVRLWKDGDIITPIGTHGMQKRLKHLVKNMTHIAARETAWALESGLESGSEIVYASMGLLAESAAVKPGEACLRLTIEIPKSPKA